MCGIAGTLVLKNGTYRITDAYVTRMRDTMVHRGPDGGANWISPDGRVGLGHRRLSIIDLSNAASQPMCNEDGSVWVVFNGEIYNHADVRSDLENTGSHHFKTDHSDTEVIVHAFEQWGISCVERFRGMFGIGIWDGKNRELWLVRDRIGVKPVYYSVHHGRVTFASEIKALLADPDAPRKVNEEAFFHYLSFLTTPSPQTLFHGIEKLPPGTWARFREDGSVVVRRWWDVYDRVSPLRDATEEEVAHRLLDELRTSVRLRKVSDVPVGVFLSGGIDSSTNAALFSEGESAAVKTFTIGYKGEYDTYKNELDFARLMAGRVNSEHHELLLSLDDLIGFLPQMVRLQDEPIADPVCVPVYFVSKLARENGVIVCQVGEGADELFFGYPGWKRFVQLEALNRLPVPRRAKGLARFPARHLLGSRPFYEEYARRAADGVPIFWGGAEAFTHAEKMRLISPRLRRMFAGRTSWEALAPIRARFDEKAWERHPLNWMSYLDLNMRLPELLLMRVDKMSMGVSLEGRVPYLDHVFVELAMSIPARMKSKDGTLKYILKKAVRGVIPDELIDRPKQGFNVPVYEWFFDRLGGRSRAELGDLCHETDFLDPLEVGRLFERGRGLQAWFLLNFALWWKEYIR